MIACLILAFSSPFELNGFLHALSAYQLALEFFLKILSAKGCFPQRFDILCDHLWNRGTATQQYGCT